MGCRASKPTANSSQLSRCVSGEQGVDTSVKDVDIRLTSEGRLRASAGSATAAGRSNSSTARVGKEAADDDDDDGNVGMTAPGAAGKRTSRGSIDSTRRSFGNNQRRSKSTDRRPSNSAAAVVAGTTTATTSAASSEPPLESTSYHRRTTNDRSNGDDRRRSMHSQGSMHSGRSSFACERTSDEEVRAAAADAAAAGPIAAQIGDFRGGSFDAVGECPDDLQPFLAPLAIIAPSTPVPVTVLQQIWRLDSVATAAQVALQLECEGALKVAQLEDGSMWCLVANGEGMPPALPAARAAQLHASLLTGYTNDDTIELVDIRDDGYILNSLGFHLVGAGRQQDLRALLLTPKWLESKLHSYGVAALVADYRRFLQHEQDLRVKLLLQAFQMSLSACAEHSGIAMLRPQMFLRMMAVAASPEWKDWYDDQRQSYMTDAAAAAGRFVVHLLARSPALGQAGGLLRMTLRGHTGAIRKVLLSPSGQNVVTISDDGTAQVWDMDIGDCTMQLARSTEPLTAAAISPDGTMLVTGSDTGRTCVWDLAKSALRAESAEQHTARINAIAVDGRGRCFITASADRTARLWELPAGRCIAVLAGHGGTMLDVGVVWDVAISASGDLAATCSDDFTIKIWEVATAECIHTLTGHQGWVVSLAFVGKYNTLVSASHDQTARIWDAENGDCLEVLEGHSGRVNKVVASPDGTRVVTCSDDYSAIVWDVDNAEKLSVLKGHGGWINDAAFTRDGCKLVTVSGDSIAVLWDVEAGGAVEKSLEGHSDEVKSVVLTWKGRFAVTASNDATARVWDLQADSLTMPETHMGKVTAVQVTRRGDKAMSVGADFVTRVWDLRTGRQLSSLKAHKASISWLTPTDSPSGFVAGSTDRRVCLCDADTAQCKVVLSEQLGSRVKSLAVDAAATVAVVVLFDSTVAAYDLRTGECTAQLMKRGERDGVRVHSGAVNAVYLTRDGAAAVTVSKDCTARVWDVRSGSCTTVLSGHTDGINSAHLSSDERMLVTASYDKTVRLWELSTGNCTAVLDHTDSINSAHFSPNGRWVLSISDSHAAWVWDVVNSTCVASLNGHRDDINGCCFTPDSRFVATYSQDCTIRVWQCHSGQLHAFFMADAAITACTMAVEGSGGDATATCIVAGDASGVVHFVDLPVELQTIVNTVS